MINEKRTIIIRDAELHWAKLNKPVEPFGTLQWELQMRTRDKDTAKSWKDDYYLTTKTEEDDEGCLLYTSPSPRDRQKSRMPSSA